MRVYQTIHKYPPHIPQFESRNGINNTSKITYSELLKLIIEDGYASAYILHPALQGKTDEVFFTIWDYERLQFLWADENGVTSRDLSEIKKAQIDWFKPDVFYNHSAFCDDDFIEKYKLDDKIIKVCWYGFIQENPLSFTNYDIRVSLHRPFVAHWNSAGLKGYELQPAFVDRWSVFNKKDKEIDVLFYGQTLSSIFKKRNRLIEKLVAFNKHYNVQIHLTLQPTSRPVLNIPFFRNYLITIPLPKLLREKTLPPIYGKELYETIGNSKFALNGYGNFNTDYKSNMRLFEALGCGSLLISEAGNYPDGFEDGKHYISYKNSTDLLKKIPSLISDYESLKEHMEPYIREIIELYSKENQWAEFQRIVLDFKNRGA